ncbi:hypothetical protein E2C01_086735 [Portunus trituberculatus]|uniref:Uncharacterized protein n=1 Tax=Portunus trituberculatus TaxID=210409 RepID=A0A5B7J1M8_PORTR|nr:hypothetical protein [Portunus trituberculatus]
MRDNDQQSTASQETEELNMTNVDSTLLAVQPPISMNEPLPAQSTPESSIQIPTKEYLDKNFRKPDLQKQC